MEERLPKIKYRMYRNSYIKYTKGKTRKSENEVSTTWS